MGEKNTQAVPFVVGAGAGLAGGLVLSQTAKKSEASSSGGELSLDTQSKQLLIEQTNAMNALAQNIALLSAALSQSGESGGNQLALQGYPKNCDDFEAIPITITALNTAINVQDMAVPDGFQVVVKAWPTNAGLIYVAKSAQKGRAGRDVVPLLPDGTVGYYLINTNLLYISGTAVNDVAVITVEQRKGE